MSAAGARARQPAPQQPGRRLRQLSIDIGRRRAAVAAGSVMLRAEVRRSLMLCCADRRGEIAGAVMLTLGVVSVVVLTVIYRSFTAGFSLRAAIGPGPHGPPPTEGLPPNRSYFISR